jgi:plastocyanin
MTRIVQLLAVLVLVTAACGNDDGTTAPPTDPGDGTVEPVDPGEEDADPPEAADGVTVDVQDLAFQPDAVDAAAGETVTWVSADTVPHTVTSTGGPADFDESLPSGASASVTFDEPGTYEYACSIHPSMTGTVTVT